MKLIKKAKSEKHKEKYKILDTYTTIHRNDYDTVGEKKHQEHKDNCNLKLSYEFIIIIMITS